MGSVCGTGVSLKAATIEERSEADVVQAPGASFRWKEGLAQLVLLAAYINIDIIVIVNVFDAENTADIFNGC